MKSPLLITFFFTFQTAKHTIYMLSYPLTPCRVAKIQTLYLFYTFIYIWFIYITPFASAEKNSTHKVVPLLSICRGVSPIRTSAVTPGKRCSDAVWDCFFSAASLANCAGSWTTSVGKLSHNQSIGRGSRTLGEGEDAVGGGVAWDSSCVSCVVV